MSADGERPLPDRPTTDRPPPDPPARERPAQQGPPADLAGFPVSRATAQTRLHRAHDRDRGPWWFSSDGAGRFDLPAPRGSCYLASTALAAVRERLGPVLAARATLPASALEHVVVSRLRPATDGRPLRLANLRVSAAGSYGVTRELESMTPYALPRRWAVALADHGLDGVRYGPRFTPGSASAVALFGPAGTDPTRAVDPHPVAAAAVAGAPMSVALPRRRDLKVISPPGRGRVSRPR